MRLISTKQIPNQVKYEILKIFILFVANQTTLKLVLPADDTKTADSDQENCNIQLLHVLFACGIPTVVNCFFDQHNFDNFFKSCGLYIQHSFEV